MKYETHPEHEDAAWHDDASNVKFVVFAVVVGSILLVAGAIGAGYVLYLVVRAVVTAI